MGKSRSSAPGPPAAAAELALPNPTDVTTLAALLENAATFHAKHPPATSQNLIAAVKGPHAEHASSARVIAHADVLATIARFLEMKQRLGSEVERRVYTNMTAAQLTARLITHRPLLFFTKNDITCLRDGSRPDPADWMHVGTPEEARCAIRMDSYLTYDEIALAALLGVSSYTTFINSGSRYNNGVAGRDGTYIREGVYIGLVGCRFEKPEEMEGRQMIVRPSSRRSGQASGRAPEHDAALAAIWAQFYGVEALPAMVGKKGLSQGGDAAPELVRLGGGWLFDARAYKRRMAVTVETLLAEANDRGAAAGRRVYVHMVGLGLGVWQVHNSQPEWLLEAAGEVLDRLKLPQVQVLDFSWFGGGESPECAGAGHEEVTHTPSGNKILIRFSKRDPAALLPGHEDCLLVAVYAWDGNSFPGNEIYCGSLSGSGDPAAAACSTIYELQNPYINNFTGKTFVAGA